MLNDDYKDMLQSLLHNKVKFLVVGAYSMGAHGYPRSTGDIDIWVEPSAKNSEKVYKALLNFGAPLSNIEKDTFTKEGIVFQIGVAPCRIDIITAIDGVTFHDAFEKGFLHDIENLKVPFLSKEHLIKNKSSTGREKDILDVKYLKAPKP